METARVIADSRGVETSAIEHRENPAAEAASPGDVGDSLRMRVFCVLVLAVVACGAVFHGWRRGYVLAPTDALRLVAPWGSGSGYVARNEQLLDQTVQFVPWMIYTIDRYRRGEVPLWNPHSQLGAPFLANGQSAIFYPTVLLHLWLPETWSWTVSAALRLFIAGLGAYVLAGRYGLRSLSRLLSGLAFMLCGFNVVWLNHPQMNVMPLLPWAILMTEMLIERVALHRVLGAALVFAVQFLGGHPASCIHLLLACGMVWVLRLFFPQEAAVGRAPEFDSAHPRRAGRLNGIFSGVALLVAIAFGLALAAAQWLPLIEYANHSGAAIVRTDRLKSAKALEFDPRYLIGVVFPYANGFPDRVAAFELRRVTHLPNTNELAPGFVGTIPLILAIFGAIKLRRARVVKMWIVIASIAALIAIKFPGIDHLVRLVPGLNVAQNARLLVVSALGLSILAGFGLEGLVLMLRHGIDVPRLRKILTWTAAGVAALAIAAGIVLFAAKGPILRYGERKAEAEYSQSTAHEHSLEYVKTMVRRAHTELLLTSARLLIPVAMLGAAALLLWWHRSRGRSLACWRWPWMGLALIDLLAFAIPFNPGAPVETYFPQTATIRKLQELPPARIAGTFRTFPPETSTAYELSDLRGYDALTPERYYRWWDHPDLGELPDYMQGYPSRLDQPQRPGWTLLNFGYLLTAPDQPSPGDKFKLLEDCGDARVYQPVTVRPRAWVAAKAEVFDSIEPVLDRIAAGGEKLNFDPDEIVLIDRDIAGKSRLDRWLSNDAQRLLDERLTSDPQFWTRSGLNGARARVQFLPPVKGETDRPEVLRLQVTGAIGGWLVLADSYFPGWTATVTAPDERTSSPIAKEVPVLPAYGVLRAVPLPQGVPSVHVEFHYRPWSWRIGALISLSAICLFVLLVGLTLFRAAVSLRPAQPARLGDL